jgi:hypothetical protein
MKNFRLLVLLLSLICLRIYVSGQAAIWDFQQGTASIAEGSTQFSLSGIQLDTSNCAGEYISIYGAGSETPLSGRQPNNGVTEMRYPPLTTTITGCSDSTHGTTAVPAGRAVTVGGACPPTTVVQGTGLTAAAIPFGDGCTRVGHDVSASINAAFETEGIVTLPSDSYGFAAGTINIGTNHEILGSNTYIYNGWEAGISSAYPSGISTVTILGTSHGNRVNNAKVESVFLDNGLDFNWNHLCCAGQSQPPMGVLIEYASEVYVQNSTLSNTLRAVGVMEDADSVWLINNYYYNNHEDSEHIGESLFVGDSVSNITSTEAHLNGYSDDGIAVVGGPVACANGGQPGGGAVTNVIIKDPIITGSDNRGGGLIYNCAIQLAGNLNGVTIYSPTITDPGYCSIIVKDHVGAVPQNVYVSGGSASAGTTSYPKNCITSSPIVISSNVARDNPSCPATYATNIEFDLMDIDMGGNYGTKLSYPPVPDVISVSGACFSVFGAVDSLWLGGNTCFNDTNAVGNYGVYLDSEVGPGPEDVAIQYDIFDFVGGSSGPGASQLLYNNTANPVNAAGNVVNYNY